MQNIDDVVYPFLQEAADISSSEYDVLTEDTKINTVKEATKSIMGNIRNCLDSIDSAALLEINKTRGNIKLYSRLNKIQSATTILSNIVTSDSNATPQVKDYATAVSSALYNLNACAPTFKEAYRRKNTVMILQYVSVVLSIIVSLSYLTSNCIDYTDPSNLKLKTKIKMTEIKAIKSLKNFNESVIDGRFNQTQKEIDNLKEYYNEYTPKELSTIYEAIDIVDFLNNGINSFISSIDKNGKISGIIYKFLGIITTVMSLRNTFYSVYNSKTKITDMLNHIDDFLNINQLSSYGKFMNNNNKITSSIEKAEDATNAEISSEDKQIVNAVANTPTSTSVFTTFTPQEQEITPAIDASATAVANDAKDTVQDTFKDFNF